MIDLPIAPPNGATNPAANHIQADGPRSSFSLPGGELLLKHLLHLLGLRRTNRPIPTTPPRRDVPGLNPPLPPGRRPYRGCRRVAWCEHLVAEHQVPREVAGVYGPQNTIHKNRAGEVPKLSGMTLVSKLPDRSRTDSVGTVLMDVGISSVRAPSGPHHLATDLCRDREEAGEGGALTSHCCSVDQGLTTLLQAMAAEVGREI